MKPYIYPLIRRQFRQMKWFLIGYLLIAAMFAMSFQNGLQISVTNLWNGWSIRDMSFGGAYRALSLDAQSMVMIFGLLTLLMAAAQQFDAYNARSALLMGSLPPTRGAALVAQLGIGIAWIVLSMLLFGALAYISLERHRAMLELDALISPWAGPLLQMSSNGVIACAVLRLAVLLISVYLGVSLVYGLFGNALFSMGVLAALGMLAYLTIITGRMALYQIRAMNPAFRELSGNAMYDAVFGMGVWQRYGSGQIQYMPWDGLIRSLLIHLGLWAIGLVGLALCRRDLAVESLGSVFLFKLSRWAVALLATMYALLIPLAQMFTYDRDLERMVIEPRWPLLFIPAALVFGLMWLFVVHRPVRRRRARALPALLLALALLMPGAAQAEAPKVRAQFDPSRLACDERIVERMDAFSRSLWQRRDAAYARDKGSDESYLSDSGFDQVRQAYDTYRSKPSYNNYQSFHYAAASVSGDIWLGGKGEITKGDLAQALYEAGLDKLASALAATKPGDKLITMQDGVWLGHMDRKADPMETDGSTSLALVYMQTPLILIGSEPLDAAICQSAFARRTQAFSNGTYDTQAYEINVSQANANRVATLQAIFLDGKLNRLMLGSDNVIPDATHEGIEAIRRATVASGYAEADSQAMAAALAALCDEDKSGSGSSGPIHWSLERNGWLNSDRNIMVTFDR